MYQYKVAQKYYDETALKQRQKASQISAISTADYSVNCREQAIYAAQRYKTDEDLTGAWDDRNFKLLAWTSNGAEMLQKIVKASADGVLLVFLGNGGGNPFKPSGLVLAIASKVPASLQQTLNDADKNTIALEKAAAKTGIAKRIERSKHNEHFLKAYYALSPSWIEDERKARSKHPVMFWLNPTSQDRYQAGYYTVEELDEWIKGRGPVVKTKAA